MEKLPKSLKSIFTPSKQCSQSSDQNLAESSRSLNSQSQVSLTKSIGEFIKSHKKRHSFSSSTLTSNSEINNKHSPQRESLSFDDKPSFKGLPRQYLSHPKITQPTSVLFETNTSNLQNPVTLSQTRNNARAITPILEISSQNSEEPLVRINKDWNELNDADIESDDNDNDINDEDNVMDYSEFDQNKSDIQNNIQNQPFLNHNKGHLSHQDAESIIGGTSLSGSEINLSGNVRSNSKCDNDGSDRKTFSFSLPFSNPLANVDFLSLKLPAIFLSNISANSESQITTNKDNSINGNPNLSKNQYLRVQKEVDNSLNRQVSISSWQEEIVYNTVKEQDNSRFRAVKLALTPSIMSSNKVDPFLDKFKGEIVIMGGYRGSILRDKQTGRRVWIPIKAGFNLRKIDLTVGLEDKDEINMDSKIYPDGMLTHIGPVDISRKLIRKLRSNSNIKVYEFSYDWRLSCDMISKKFSDFLKNLPSNNENLSNHSKRKRPIVIAHSMGGLIAHHAMQKNPDLFRGLLYAGVPSACPNILGPLRNGDSILLSSKILTAQVNFLMRSSYVFLPLNGRCFVNINDHNVKYDLDFFDVNTWVEHELSPLVIRPENKNHTEITSKVTCESNICNINDSIDVNTTDNVSYNQQTNNFNTTNATSPSVFIRKSSSSTNGASLDFRKNKDSFTYPDQLQISFEEAVKYLDHTLKRTKQFLLDLEYDEKKADNYPPLACLYSYSIPTLKGAKVLSKEAIRSDSYENFIFGPGDGVVYYKWLMPQSRGFDVVAKVSTDRGHVSLLNDVDGVLKALSALLKNENDK